MLEIGNKKIVKIKNPINKYKLVISNMSGDADAYHKTTTLFGKENEALIEEIVEICEWSGKSWPSRDDIEEKYENLLEKYENVLDEDEPIFTRDVTNDGDSICRPSIASLTWFDENGEEFNVKYK